MPVIFLLLYEEALCSSRWDNGVFEESLALFTVSLNLPAELLVLHSVTITPPTRFHKTVICVYLIKKMKGTTASTVQHIQLLINSIVASSINKCRSLSELQFAYKKIIWMCFLPEDITLSFIQSFLPVSYLIDIFCPDELSRKATVVFFRWFPACCL